MPAHDGPADHDGSSGDDRAAKHGALASRDGWTVVPVPGDLDYYSADGLHHELAELIADGTRHVVLDMGGVEFMDSTGLRVLLGVARDLRAAGGGLRLAATHEHVMHVINLTQVGPILPTYADVGAACDA